MDHKHITRVLMGALAVIAVVSLSGSALGAPGDLDPSETVEIDDQNDSVTVDVEFNDSFVNSTTYEGETFAYLELTDPNGTVVKSHNLTVNESDLNTTQIAVDSDTVWFTQSFSDFDKDDVGNLTVELADHGDGLNDTVVSVDSGGLFGGGILGGASKTQVLFGVVALVGGLILVRRMDG